MNRAINITQVKESRYPNPKHNRNFERAVFKVNDPPCPECMRDMDFSIFENFQGTGQDWVQWKCTNCSFFKNVEIL